MSAKSKKSISKKKLQDAYKRAGIDKTTPRRINTPRTHRNAFKNDIKSERIQRLFEKHRAKRPKTALEKARNKLQKDFRNATHDLEFSKLKLTSKSTSGGINFDVFGMDRNSLLKDVRTIKTAMKDLGMKSISNELLTTFVAWAGAEGHQALSIAKGIGKILKGTFNPLALFMDILLKLVEGAVKNKVSKIAKRLIERFNKNRNPNNRDWINEEEKLAIQSHPNWRIVKEILDVATGGIITDTLKEQCKIVGDFADDMEYQYGMSVKDVNKILKMVKLL